MTKNNKVEEKLEYMKECFLGTGPLSVRIAEYTKTESEIKSILLQEEEEEEGIEKYYLTCFAFYKKNSYLVHCEVLSDEFPTRLLLEDYMEKHHNQSNFAITNIIELTERQFQGLRLIN